MGQSDFGREGLITERNVMAFMFAGALAHTASFYLEAVTLRHSLWLWGSIVVPSIFAYAFFFRDVKPISKYEVRISTYVKVVVIHLCLFIGICGMAGGYINALVLGINYYGRSDSVHVIRFRVVEIRHVSHKGRFEQLLVVITNGTLTKEIHLPLKDEEQLKKYLYLDRHCAEGLFGWDLMDELPV